MLDAVIIFLSFAAPILLLLFVKRSRKMNVVFPHYLIEKMSKYRVSYLLLKIFQLFYDTMFDFLMAIVLAVFLSGLILSAFASGKNAVVIDGSLSVEAVDETNKRALDQIAETYFANAQSFGKYDLYILAFDPEKGKSRLYQVNRLKKAPNPAALVQELRSKFVFATIDYTRMQYLYNKGYKNVFFLTDFFPFEDSTLKVIECGSTTREFFYPVACRYLPDENKYRIDIYRTTGQPLPTLQFFYPDRKNVFMTLQESDFTVKLNGGRYASFTVSQPGLYRLKTDSLSFVVHCGNEPLPVRSDGSLASLLVKLFPDALSENRKADIVVQSSDVGTYTGKTRGKKGFLTLVYPESSSLEEAVYPPSYGFGTLLRAEIDPQLLTRIVHESNGGLTPVFIRKKNLGLDGVPLMFRSQLALLRPEIPDWSVELKGGGKLIQTDNTAFLYVSITGKKSQFTPVDAAPEEFFPVKTDESLRFRRQYRDDYFLFAILLLLYAAKVVLGIWFGDRKQGM